MLYIVIPLCITLIILNYSKRELTRCKTNTKRSAYTERTFTMNDNKTRALVITGSFVALTIVVTMTSKIPIPGGYGYVNLGDAVVLVSALLLGKKSGAYIGGISSALADIFLGYMMFVPLTLITKGLEGYLCGLIYEKFPTPITSIIAAIVGGATMVLGYFIGEIYLYDLGVSLAAIWPNTMQAIIGVIVAIILFNILKNRITR